MKRKKFFNGELLVLMVIGIILLVLLLVMGSHYIINKVRLGTEMNDLIIVTALLVCVVVLLIVIVAMFLINRYKSIRSKSTAERENLTRLTIEEVSQEGADEMVAFFDEVVGEVVDCGNLPCWEKGVYPASPFVEQAVKRGSMFAVRHDGKIIGAFDLSTSPDGDYSLGRWKVDAKDGEYLVIHALVVRKTYQSQGIARHMIKYAIKLAKDFGMKALRADCTLLNGKAMRLFESIGFVSAGAVNLGRNVKGASCFQLYEYNLENSEFGIKN